MSAVRFRQQQMIHSTNWKTPLQKTQQFCKMTRYMLNGQGSIHGKGRNLLEQRKLFIG